MWENVEDHRKRREAREQRRATRPQRRFSLAMALSGIGLAATLAIGSWWTASAVADGMVPWTIIRFALTVAIGTYYVVWFNNSRAAIEVLRIAEIIVKENPNLTEAHPGRRKSDA